MRNLSGCLVIVLLLMTLPAGAAPPAAEDLLARAIARHDPEGLWFGGTFRLSFEESRPGGSVRKTRIVIDNARGHFEIESERGGRPVHGVLGDGECSWKLDGSSEISDAEREELRLTCERLKWTRNYYVYLWGMPMKLRDHGTRIEPVITEKEFEGRRTWEMRVTYDEAVGSDVWYFYFDISDSSLVGYRFYHDETANDGEYIVLESLQSGAGLSLPKTRAWYTHQEDEHLGTDSLVALEAVDARQ